MNISDIEREYILIHILEQKQKQILELVKQVQELQQKLEEQDG